MDDTDNSDLKMNFALYKYEDYLKSLNIYFSSS